MPPEPNESQIRMAREALELDIKKWREGADVMVAAKQQAASLGLTGFHFGHLPTQAGIEGRYDELQNFVTRILTEGAIEMEKMEWVLQTVLDNYGRADQGAAGRIERTWGST